MRFSTNYCFYRMNQNEPRQIVSEEILARIRELIDRQSEGNSEVITTLNRLVSRSDIGGVVVTLLIFNIRGPMLQCLFDHVYHQDATALANALVAMQTRPTGCGNPECNELWRATRI